VPSALPPIRRAMAVAHRYKHNANYQTLAVSV
jgi:hypothetical protein